jgi:minichromosome maintenance protein 10
MTVFVPSSPEKVARVTTSLQHGYERQRHAALYGGGSSSIAASTSTTIREPALASQKSSFLASSAIAHRSAGSLLARSSKSSQTKTFKRNAESDLRKAAAVAPTVGQQRDDSLRLIETLPIGPKEMSPPEDDPHFLKYEPTSGIALRQRKMPHPEMVSHLEGRYYIPISTLYSIAVPGRCDDGDFSIPVEGDWVTMGVVVKRSEVLLTKPIGIDHLGRRLNKDGIPIDDNNNPFMTPEEKKEISRKNQGAGQMKELEPKRFIVFTLLDISNQPDKFGQHDGSCEIELALFEADTSVVDLDGQRKYYGGSNGAYEKLLMATYGTLVCILNPKVRKGYVSNL